MSESCNPGLTVTISIVRSARDGSIIMVGGTLFDQATVATIAEAANTALREYLQVRPIESVGDKPPAVKFTRLAGQLSSFVVDYNMGGKAEPRANYSAEHRAVVLVALAAMRRACPYLNEPALLLLLEAPFR